MIDYIMGTIIIIMVYLIWQQQLDKSQKVHIHT